MNRTLVTTLSLAILLFFSCSKSKQPGPQNNSQPAVTISLVSGGGQTDTIGQTLPNNIVVKVTQNGNPLSGYKVKFQGSGCNTDRVDSLLTDASGIASDLWGLAGDVGQQTMKIYAVNAQNVKVDSVTATSTGLATGPGWHYSACSIQGGFVPSGFCKLSTGRIFVSYNGLGLRYSDDNGISWNGVTSLGNKKKPTFVVSSTNDELFVFTSGNGLFYSTDAGTTWAVISNVPFGAAQLFSAACTPSGKLIVTTETSVFVSADKGNTWITPANKFEPPNSTGGDTQISSPAEDKNGNLYVVGQETETIYESADNGNTWTAIPRQSGYEYDFSLYIDNNNWFYKSRSDNDITTGGISISKDNGTTYTQFISYANSFISNMSVQSDGNFYFDILGLGVYKTNGITNSAKLIYNNGFLVATPYIVAKNGNIIVNNTGSGIISYYTK